MLSPALSRRAHINLKEDKSPAKRKIGIEIEVDPSKEDITLAWSVAVKLPKEKPVKSDAIPAVRQNGTIYIEVLPNQTSFL